MKAAKRPKAGKAPSIEGALAPRGRATYETGMLFGPTGCGKTSTAHEIADAYARQGGRCWAIDPSRAWRGVRGVVSVWPGLRRLDDELGGDDPETGAVTGLAAEPAGLVIFDDADRYLRRPSQVRDDWMVSFRHFQKDLLIISRRPQGVPKDAVSNATWIALFAGSTTDPYARAYLRETFDAQSKEVLRQVPTEPYQYLYCYRVGGVWSLERRQTRARPVVTASDKPG